MNGPMGRVSEEALHENFDGSKNHLCSGAASTGAFVLEGIDALDNRIAHDRLRDRSDGR